MHSRPGGLCLCGAEAEVGSQTGIRLHGMRLQGQSGHPVVPRRQRMQELGRFVLVENTGMRLCCVVPCGLRGKRQPASFKRKGGVSVTKRNKEVS